jgi:hypothetical protein
MPSTYPTFQTPGGALNFVTASGSYASAPLSSQISAPLPNGDYFIPGRFNSDVIVLMAYNASGQLDTSFNGGLGFIPAPQFGSFSSSRAPVVAIGNGQVLVAGTDSATQKDALFVYSIDSNGALTQQSWVGNNSTSDVPLPSANLRITGIGIPNNASGLVAVSDGANSYLYCWNGNPIAAEAPLQWGWNPKFGFAGTTPSAGSGSIKAPSGYTFTGSGGIYYSNNGNVGVYAATDSKGGSCLIAYNTGLDLTPGFLTTGSAQNNIFNGNERTRHLEPV